MSRSTEPRSNMDLLAGGVQAPAELQAAMAELNDQLRAQAVRPLDIRVPTAGVHYQLSKLYANQSDQESWIAVQYASTTGARWGNVISILGALLVCAGVLLHLRPRPGQWPRLPAALAGGGGLLWSVRRP